MSQIPREFVFEMRQSPYLTLGNGIEFSFEVSSRKVEVTLLDSVIYIYYLFNPTDFLTSIS